eukprot:275141_1
MFLLWLGQYGLSIQCKMILMILTHSLIYFFLITYSHMILWSNTYFVIYALVMVLIFNTFIYGKWLCCFITCHSILFSTMGLYFVLLSDYLLISLTLLKTATSITTWNHIQYITQYIYLSHTSKTRFLFAYVMCNKHNLI